MSIAANQYANKTFSEHPIAMWPLDEQAYYVSQIDDNDRKFSTWTNSGTDRVNFVPNPSFGTDTSTWAIAGTGTTIARITSDGVFGSSCVEVTKGSTANSGLYCTTAIPIIVGNTYTVSAYFKIPSGQENTTGLNIHINWLNSALTGLTDTPFSTTSVLTSASGWTRITSTGTAPAGAAYARIYIQQYTLGTAGQKFLVDGVMMEQSSSVNSYFDGSTNGGAWIGTANASPSVVHAKDRVNMIPNPSFEIDLSYTSTVNTTGLRSTATFIGGSASLEATVSNAAAAQYVDYMPLVGASGSGIAHPSSANTIYTFSSYVYIPATNTADTPFQLIMYAWNGTAYTELNRSISTTLTRGTWSRLSVTAKTLSDTVGIVVRVLSVNLLAVGQKFYIDAGLLEESLTAYPYFDATWYQNTYGGIQYVINATWDGVAHASKSRIKQWSAVDYNSNPIASASPFTGTSNVYSMVTKTNGLPGMVELQSPSLFTATDLTQALNTFCVNMFLYQNNSNINWFKFGYRYLNASSQLIEVYSDEIAPPTSPSSSWINFNETYGVPTSWTGGLQLFIQINFNDSEGDTESRKVTMHALSVGQGSESTCYDSLGINQITLPTELNLSGFSGVSADQFGMLSDNGYYLVKNNYLLAHNDGLPIIFGTDHSTKIYPASGNLPSLIFPGKGMLHENGRNKQYTFEMWLKIDPSTSNAQRILGPLDSTDGIYVKEGFISLVIGDEIGSHSVSEWYRPMLLHISLRDNTATMMINGEQVVSIPISRDTMDLPTGRDWWGIYSYSTIDFFDVDCLSIFPYIVSEIVGKRRFVYGLGTPNIQSIDNAYQGVPTTVEFATAEYDASIIYPDIARWDAGYFNNMTATRDYLSVPDYKLPVINIGGRDIKEWYADNLTVNKSEYPSGSHPKFVTFRPNTITRTNLCTNPTLEIDTTGWTTGVNSSIARSTAQSLYGSASLLVTRTTATLGNCWGRTTFSAIPGKTYTLSVWVKCASGTVTGGVIYLGDGLANSSSAFTATTTWTRLTLTKTFALNSSAGNIFLGLDNSTTIGAQVYFDGVLIEEASSVKAYFDGSYVDPTIKPVGSQTWTGTAHASSSTVTYWDSDGINYQSASYFNFPTLNILNDPISAVYGIFEVEKNIATPRPLMSFVNVLNGQTFNINIEGSNIKYVLNGTTISTIPITLGIENLVGINFEAAGTAFGYDVSRFFASPSSIQLYVGGDGVTTYEGKIYSVGFCNQSNYSKVATNFSSNGLAIPINYEILLDHLASYTLLAENQYNRFFLDIAVSSEWEEYFPLSYFASYIKDENGNLVYDVDLLQVNIGYKTIESTTVWTYDTLKTEFAAGTYNSLRSVNSIYPNYFNLKKRNTTGTTIDVSNSSLQGYITFQTLASGANAPLESFSFTKTIPVNYVVNVDSENTVLQPQRAYQTKFSFKDNMIFYPPKAQNFEDYAMVVHLEVNQRSILANPLKIKNFEISAKNLNYNSATQDPTQSNYVGTKFGKKMYVGSDFLGEIDYKSQSPYFIYKASTPYLYTTKKSGINVINETYISGSLESPLRNRMFIPINESGSLDYSIAALQFMIKPNFVNETASVKLFDIKHKNGIYSYVLDKTGNTSTVSVYSFTDVDVLADGGTPSTSTYPTTFDNNIPDSSFSNNVDFNLGPTSTIITTTGAYTPLSGTYFYENGKYVASLVLNNNEWSAVGIVFPNQLDFSEYKVGGISMYGGFTFNNLSYYVASGLGTKSELTVRTWQNVFTADGSVPSGSPWSYWDGKTWQTVYVTGQKSSYVTTPADIYDAYVGTNGNIIDDGYGILMTNSKTQMITSASWDIFSGKPA